MTDSLVHRANATDPELAKEAADFLARSPRARFVAALWSLLGTRRPKWWTARITLDRWPVTDRMGWLRERPDVRQRIASELTGLPPNTARKKLPEFQAALIDEALDGGDLTHDKVEQAFTGEEIAIYAPAGAVSGPVFELLMKHMEADRGLMTKVLELALEPGADGVSLLRPLDIRRAIDPGTWQVRIPLGTRASVDRERLAREATGRPFTTADEFTIVGIAAIAENMSGRELAPALAALNSELGGRPPAEGGVSDVALTIRRPAKGAALPLPPLRPVPTKIAPREEEEEFEDASELVSIVPPPPAEGPPRPKRLDSALNNAGRHTHNGAMP